MKFSIITPVYNREDCIKRCLDSVIENLRWGISIEHIVVDDGSKDKTPQIIDQYAKKYEHIKFFLFSQNRGTNAARNKAIEVASGDFCIILDSDDYFVNDAIKIINENIELFSGYKHYLFTPNDRAEYFS